MCLDAAAYFNSPELDFFFESQQCGGVLPVSPSATPTEDQLIQANPRYKTEICRNFKETNKCIYGEQCQFAHGKEELRDIVRNTKYKTKLCQKYWINGYCVYGPRCNFLHNEDNRRENAAIKR